AYRCLIKGSGAEPKWSDYVLVNVLHPAEITRQPEDQRVNMGEHVLLEVEAHIVADEGTDDAFYQPDVQWFKGMDSVKNDFGVDGHYSGAQSTILSVRNVTAEEIGDDYYVVLTGACETLTSDAVSIMEFPSLFITGQPDNAAICEGQPVTFDVTAAASDPTAELTYEWRINGQGIPNATESTYTIDPVTPLDTGEYDCVVTVLPGGASKVSDPARLDVKLVPTITVQPVGLTAVAGNPFSLFITALEGESFQWYFEGSSIPSATISTYSVASATLSDEGDYTCEVTNECGSVMSDVAHVAYDAGGMTGVDDMINGGFRLTANTPNPFTEASTIRFYAPTSTSVRISITNVYGQEVALLVDGVYSGWNDVEVNASQYKLSSGVYYYTMTSNSYSITRKMIVVR
ncbi:immunoglobulin domain-containing protein, partial [Bacteroidota bacterium]